MNTRIPGFMIGRKCCSRDTKEKLEADIDARYPFLDVSKSGLVT